MNKIAVASLGALISLSALGQDLLQCVNPDVINSLLMTSREAPEFIVSSERPEQLAGFETPAGFAWIGSRHSSYDTRAAWRTDLEMESAVVAFTAAMTSAGITPLPDGDDSGFELTSAPLLSVVCSNETVGVLMVRDVNDTRFMTFSFTDPLLSRSCEEVAAPRQTPGMSRGFELIPKLVVPTEVAISSRPGAMPTGVGSGSGDTYTRSIEVEGVDSMAGLVTELADQIRDQGWVADTQWSGTLSAGSTWTRTLDDGTELAGKLSAQSIGSGYHDLTFMLVLLN